MDEFTAERFGVTVPYAEAYARPMPLRATRRVIEARRVTLCGTADLAVLDPGGDFTVRAAENRERRLVDAIRMWVA